MRPTRNPFPPQAFATIEGVDWTRFAREPTFERYHMTLIGRLIDRHLKAHSEGRAIAIHGEHGTGKTFCLLRSLIPAVLRAGTEDDETPPPVVLYGRADGTEGLTLYKSLMSRVTLRDMQRLAADAFAGYAANAFETTRAASSTNVQIVSDLLHERPDLIESAVDSAELSRSSLIDAQERDLARINGRTGTFDKAVRALLSDHTAKIAHRWMSGAKLADGELTVLGIDSNIDSPSDIRTGLHVMAALSRQARRPFILALDQVESFLMVTAPQADNAASARRDVEWQVDRSSAGYLRSILEAVINEKGLVIVSMNHTSWRQIPEDLKQRLRPSNFEVEALSTSETSDFLAAYLAEWDMPVEAFISAKGLKALLAATGGNLRTFLQSCFVAYERLGDSLPITEGDLREILDQSGNLRLPSSANAVRQVISDVLRRLSIPFRVDAPSEGSGIVGFDLAAEAATRSRVLINVSNPIYVLDEADVALEALDLVRQRKGKQGHAVLVVAGYSSPDIAQILSGAYDLVLTTSRPSWEADLEAHLLSVVLQRSEGNELASFDTATLERLTKQIEDLKSVRSQELRDLETRLATVSDVRATERLPEELRNFRLLWLSERERLISEMTQARATYQQRDFEEMTQVHESVVQARSVAFRRRAALRYAVLGGSLITFLLILSFLTSPNFPQYAYVLIALAIAAVVGLGFALTGNRGRPALPNPTDLEALKRQARQRVATSRFDPLLDVDPYTRYARIFSEYRRFGEVMKDSLREEPTAIIRRVIAQKICEEMSTKEAYDFIRASTDDPGAMSKLVEHAGLTGDYILLELQTRSLRTLAAFYGLPLSGPDFLSQFLADRSGKGSASTRGLFAVAFDSDRDIDLLRAVSGVSERTLRQAASALDPANPTGIGSFYWLHAKPELDEIYLFFRRAQLIAGLGLEPPK